MHLDLVHKRLKERHRSLRIGMCRKSFQKSTDISFGQDFIAACGVEFNQSDGRDLPWLAVGVALSIGMAPIDVKLLTGVLTIFLLAITYNDRDRLFA